jgi:hypothetical protein
MKKRLLLSLLTAAMLLSTSSMAGAHAHRARHHGVRYPARYQPVRDYYPQQPRYQESQTRRDTNNGVLGSALGYEIVKDEALTSELGTTSGSYLGKSVLKRR